MRRYRGSVLPPYDSVREMRRFRAWAASLEFPDAPWEGRQYWCADHLAIRDVLIDEDGRPVVIARAAQVLLDAAARLADLKPARHRDTRVVTVLERPRLLNSFINVFFDEAYFAEYKQRDEDDRRWTPIEARSLARDWGLSVPKGFSEVGFTSFLRNEDYPEGDTAEIWLIGEVDPR